MSSALRVESHPARVGLASLWFGVLAGPIVWSLLTLVNYAVAAQSCQPAGRHLAHPLFTSVKVVGGIATLVGFAIVVAALLVSVRSGRIANDADVPRDAVWNRVHFMALSGIIVSAVFLYAILLHGLGVLFVTSCT